MAQVRQNFTCFKCKSVIKGDYKALTTHFRHNHAMKTSFTSKATLTCFQNGCEATFSNFANYSYHLKNCKSFSKVQQEAQPRKPTQSVPTQINSDLQAPVSVAVLDNLSSSNRDFFDKMMLDLKSKHNVSNAALDFLSVRLREGQSGIEGEFNCDTKCLTEGVVTRPQNYDSHNNLSVNSLYHLDSQKKRNQYYVRHFNFLEPEELLVKTTLETRLSNGRTVVESQNNTFQFMSIRIRLSALFSNEKFRRLYFSEQPSSTDGFMKTSRDSLFFKTHALFSRFPNAFAFNYFLTKLRL